MTEPISVLVQHDSPLGDLAVPLVDGVVHVVARGVATEVPAAVAGRVPGPWEPIEGVPGWDDGRLYRQAETGVWEARDPGAGLLAQSDVWSLAKASRKSTTSGPASDSAGAITSTSQEG